MTIATASILELYELPKTLLKINASNLSLITLSTTFLGKLSEEQRIDMKKITWGHFWVSISRSTPTSSTEW